MSSPNCLYFFTVSGETATRRSWVRRSFGMAIFILAVSLPCICIGFKFQAAGDASLSPGERGIYSRLHQLPHMRRTTLGQPGQIVPAFQRRNDLPPAMPPGNRKEFARDPGEVFGLQLKLGQRI